MNKKLCVSNKLFSLLSLSTIKFQFDCIFCFPHNPPLCSYISCQDFPNLPSSLTFLSLHLFIEKNNRNKLIISIISSATYLLLPPLPLHSVHFTSAVIFTFNFFSFSFSSCNLIFISSAISSVILRFIHPKDFTEAKYEHPTAKSLCAEDFNPPHFYFFLLQSTTFLLLFTSIHQFLLQVYVRRISIHQLFTFSL